MLLVSLLLVRRLWEGEKVMFFSGSGFLGSLEIVIVWGSQLWGMDASRNPAS